MHRRFAFALAAALLAACSDHSDVPTASPDAVPTGGTALNAAGVPTTAEVEFGIEEGKVGTDFPLGSHDRSFHAFDKVQPHTVTIARGGSVTYEIYPLHQPTVFEPGTRPEDVDTSQTEPIAVFPVLERIVIDDPGLLALALDQSFEEKEWTTPPGTFDEPSTYLVICTTLVHFVEAKMYGWVIVK
jgi:hypothetical protein